MPRPFRSLCLLLALCCAITGGAAAQSARQFRGRALQEVIEELRSGGLPLVYSSNLVPGTLRVEVEPQSSSHSLSRASSWLRTDFQSSV